MPVSEPAVAVFSMAARSPTGEDAAYLEWHQLDHLPEQYQIEGLRLGQRWASTPATRAARAAEADGFGAVDHLTQYLFAGSADRPVERALDDFLDLGADLHRRGRYAARLPSVLLAAFERTGAWAAPRVLVSPEVVPFRAHLGVYLILERADAPSVSRPDRPWRADGSLAALVDVDGVAGAWSFAPGAGRPDRFDPRGLDLTLCFLDDDPVTVAHRLAAPLAERWDRWPITPTLAAPFETVWPWQWDRFG